MGSMTIGEFAARTRLSPKALRLYDQLGLLRPARVDPSNGSRRYDEEQVAAARLVAMLRHIDMPLATIGDVVAVAATDPAAAAGLLATFWMGISARAAERGALVPHTPPPLPGAPPPPYTIQPRPTPARTVLAVTRHV